MDLCVLMGAEVVLQPLETADERHAGLLVEERPEALDDVPQALGILAQVVQVLRRRTATDRSPVLDQALEGPVGLASDHFRQWRIATTTGVRLAGLQPRAPCGRRSHGVTSAEDVGHRRVLLVQLGLQECFERRQIRPHLLAQIGRVAVPLLHVDVEIARSRGLRTDPTQVRRGGTDFRSSQYLLAELQHRTAPAHCDAKVVEELRIAVFERASPVRLQRRRQAQQNCTEAFLRRHRRIDRRGRLAGPTAKVATSTLDGSEDVVLLDGLHAEAGERRGEPLLRARKRCHLQQSATHVRVPLDVDTFVAGDRQAAPCARGAEGEHDCQRQQRSVADHRGQRLTK